MDVQAMKTIRRLYRTDPQFRRAIGDDPEAALIRWELAGSETARALASSLRGLLERLPEEVLASVLTPDLPDWHGPTPTPMPPG